MNRLFINADRVIRFLKKILYTKKLHRLIFNFLTNTFGLQIVTREQLVNNPEKYHTIFFSSEESIKLEKPFGVDEIPKVIQPIINQLIRLKQPFVSEFKNAQIVGSTATVFNKNKQIIEESIPSIYDLPIRTLISQKIFIANTSQLDTVCPLVNAANHVYGHWITDCLMRLEGVEYYQKVTGRKPILVLNHNLKSWQIDSLKLLGYEPKDYIQWNYSLKGFNAERVVVASFRRQGTWVEPSACQWLKQRILSNLPPLGKQEFPFSPRIYISRKKELGRQVINEDEVMELLRPLGFISYTLENMNFLEEVKLFSQAEIIIGAHGSGLTNLLFSQNQVTVIDLFSSWYTNWFFNLSASVGCQYTCLKCQSAGKTIKLTRGNMVVDVGKLEQLVDKSLL